MKKKIAPGLTAFGPQPNAKQAKARVSKIKKSALAMRKELWPDITEDALWLRQDSYGFTTIPRTMALFIELINDASKHVTTGKSVPAGKSYLVLWCRVFDEAFVKIDVDAVAAKEAGYTGERNVSTWREHLRVLSELGFIRYEQGAAGPCQYILLLNPYHVVQKLVAKKWVQRDTYVALLQRTHEIGATDLDPIDEE